jgi:hypothetical protein
MADQQDGKTRRVLAPTLNMRALTMLILAAHRSRSWFAWQQSVDNAVEAPRSIMIVCMA